MVTIVNVNVLKKACENLANRIPGIIKENNFDSDAAEHAISDMITLRVYSVFISPSCIYKAADRTKSLFLFALDDLIQDAADDGDDATSRAAVKMYSFVEALKE